MCLTDCGESLKQKIRNAFAFAYEYVSCIGKIFPILFIKVKTF